MGLSLLCHVMESQFTHPGTFTQGINESSALVEEQGPPPELGRTRSIQLEYKIDCDSDELFGFTSDDSKDYVPEFICSEDSWASKESHVLQTAEEMNNLSTLYSNIGSTSPVKEGKQLSDRGRSLSKSSPKPRKRRRISPSCPAPHSRSPSPKQQEESEEQQCSSSSPPDSVPVSLKVPAVRRKQDGSRLYDKKQYCLFCKGVVRLSRHLELVHKNEREVAQALSYDKGSKERNLHFEHLRNRGNFAHNIEVLQAGTGHLVPRKQPREDTDAKDFLHCSHCQGLFRKKILRKHMSKCKFKPPDQPKRGKTAAPPPLGLNEDFWKLLSNMVNDEVTIVVKTDQCILEFGLWSKKPRYPHLNQTAQTNSNFVTSSKPQQHRVGSAG
ncbi:uncharacterized protein LOC129410829 [Boleophthalmus pectinirostris]|uniref:uncharacterized protein LOC129410829 n=1 Tax=Boleophthalmus pectinirostris TaxID=150288 RepID=UPI00242A81BB|nr:uncharacterized protein LOC129410829 [Boleophthalmus pectinirostris]